MRTLLTISDHPSVDHAVDSVAVQIAATLQLAVHSLTQPQLADIDRIVDDTDAAMLVVGIRPSSRIQHYLNALRSLRIPYLFVKEQHTSFVPKTIILPVTNLLEDREKGPYASSLARHFNSTVNIIKPNDYGSRAQTNIDAIVTLFTSLDVDYAITPSKADSTKLQQKALALSSDPTGELLVITASRDYGLDDLIFGPAERKIVARAAMPLLVVNPRADLYPLCD